MELAGLQILAPGWLLLLPPLWLAAYLLARFRRRRSAWREVCDPQLLAQMERGQSARGTAPILSWLLLLLFTLAILAAAGPAWRAQTAPASEYASARVLVLELSRAMLVRDLKPDRLTQALAAARAIVETEFEGETGLVVYAGAAFKVAPLSRDKSTLLAFLDELRPEVMPVDGARLDYAIDSARDLLTASVFGRGQIIVFTSGTGEVAAALAAAKSARSDGHQVSLMAFGSAAGAPLVDSEGALVRNANGAFVLSRTNFDGLAAIAEAGNGQLVTLQQATASGASLLRPRLEAATLLEAEFESEQAQTKLADEGYWLLWAMLPLALLLFRKNLLWVFLLALWLPPGGESLAGDATGWLWQHDEKRAFDAYANADFERSQKLATQPLLKGSAYYRSGLYQQAVDEFARDDSAIGAYNRGNGLVQLEQYEAALAAYEEALELDPALKNARYNRRLLQIFLQNKRRDESASTDDDADSETENEDSGEGAEESRVFAPSMSNPADQQQLESGFGASLQSGQVDPFENLDGREQDLDRFLPRETLDAEQAANLVEHWVKTLPTTSSDLFKRKFLRDYQRQQRDFR